MKTDEFVELVKQAVLQKQCIQFDYQEHSRFACPHLLGKNKDGRLVLHAFQYAGASSKGPIPSPEQGAWRFFYLDEMPWVGPIADQNWYPPKLAKSEGEYTPPKFITEVIALHPKQEQ